MGLGQNACVLTIMRRAAICTIKEGYPIGNPLKLSYMLKGKAIFNFGGKLIYNLPFAQYSFLLAQYGSILPISALHKCQQMPFLCLLQQSLPISFIQKKSDLVGLSNKVALIFNFAFLMIIGFAPNHSATLFSGIVSLIQTEVNGF